MNSKDTCHIWAEKCKHINFVIVRTSGNVSSNKFVWNLWASHGHEHRDKSILWQRWQLSYKNISQHLAHFYWKINQKKITLCGHCWNIFIIFFKFVLQTFLFSASISYILVFSLKKCLATFISVADRDIYVDSFYNPWHRIFSHNMSVSIGTLHCFDIYMLMYSDVIQ